MNLFTLLLFLLAAHILGAVNGTLLAPGTTDKTSLSHKLVMAVTEGNTIVIQQLLNNYGNHLTNVESSEGEPLLHLALRNNHLNVIELLIEHGAHVSAWNRQRRTPLHIAAQIGNFEGARLLIDAANRHLNIDDRDETGCTPLHLAAHCGHIDLVMLLLQNDASLTAKAKVMTPLMEALLNRRSEVARLLMKQSGVPFNDFYSLGWSTFCLHFAVYNGDTRNVKLCIENGMSVNQHDNALSTALHYAVGKGNVAITLMLLEHANVDVLDGDGQTALHVAASAGSCELIAALLNHGAHVDTLDRQQQSPLYMAALHGQHAAFTLLQERGADISLVMSNHLSLLQRMTWRGHDSLVTMLVRMGAVATASLLRLAVKMGHAETTTALLSASGGGDVHIPDWRGDTLLHYAATRGHASVIQTLMAHGSVLQPNLQGQTAIHLAITNRRLDAIELLLSLGDTASDASLLFCAIKTGDCQIVGALIRNGGKVNQQDAKGNTPLYLATSLKHQSMVRLLLEHGADPNRGSDFNETPLHCAVFLNDVTVAELLLKHHADMNAPNLHGQTPLHRAVRSVKYGMVDFLKSHGANLNAVDRDRMTPLHWTVMVMDMVNAQALCTPHTDHQLAQRLCTPHTDHQLAQALCMPHTDHQLLDRNGHAAIHIAAARCFNHVNHVRIIDLLTQHTDVNFRDLRGWTPLFHAVLGGCVNVAKALLRNGADMTVVDSHGLTALHYAHMNGDDEIVAVLREAAGGDDATVVNYANLVALRSDGNGDTLLHRMVHNNCMRIAKELLAHGADIDARNDAQRTPLHYAVMRGHIAMVEFLLLARADAKAACSNGQTPLHYAAKASGSRQLIKMLLRHGAEIDRANRFGMTALHVAAAHGQRDVVSILLASRANPLLLNKTRKTAVMLVAENDYTTRRLFKDGAGDDDSDSDCDEFHCSTSDLEFALTLKLKANIIEATVND